MNHIIGKGDILIIGEQSYIIIEDVDSHKYDGYKYSLMNIETFSQDLRMKDLDLNLGDIIFGREEDGSAIKLINVIPKKKVSINWRLFGN